MNNIRKQLFHIISNNTGMLKTAFRISPEIVIVPIVKAVLGAVIGFFANAFVIRMVINGFQKGEPVKDAIQKSEGETGEETETDEPSDDDEEESVDDQKVITKSVDPDMARSSQIESEKNFCQRMGRNENGMSW